MNKRKTGQEQEVKAACFLKTQRYQILERNYRCKKGEIDLIAREGQYLVFVEVKYRSTNESGLPEEAVDLRKHNQYVIPVFSNNSITFIKSSFVVI